LPLNSPERGFSNVRQCTQPVYGDISAQYPGGIRIRLKGNRARPADARGEYSITPNICANIQKQIIGPEKVEQEAHLGHS
jgi:hypothetical protein